ncbi:amidohydrolase family protein [Gordonia rubripertincta]|uniref:Amidohydrolase family protein n=1 Tax=Gordonia rubripertincta TaxID=36822 RepID=A0ABT4MX80_GORRU|nr:amidohydrolase family protein [Gordonia rubripertincta]MCZ4551629.1 amidohydrolase family protein [Gordonia rubripertincta]
MSEPEALSAAEVDAVRAVWQQLGLPGLIDVHTHFMPKPVMDKVWAYFDSVGPLVGREWPITYRADEDRRVEVLHEFGVRAFTSMIYPHKPEMAAWLNSWAADFAARTPDCLHTATFYPEVSAPHYVEAAIESGVRIFKSHIQVGNYDPTDPLLDGVWGAISDAAIPVVIHCGSGPAPGQFTGPQPITELLRKFPRLPLVIAHMGMPEYDEFLDLATTYDRVHLDTTMAFTDFAEEMAPFPISSTQKLRDLGDRILWGSDFPNIPYTYTSALDAVTRLGLGDDWARGVFYDNAARLFQIT